MSEETVGRIRALRAQGKSLREIAAAVGLSTYPVRQALGLVGAERASADEASEAEAASTDEGERDDAEKSTHPEPGTEAGADVGLAPVPLPVPRTAERALARYGLLYEKARVFIEGAGLRRLGGCSSCPRWRRPGSSTRRRAPTKQHLDALRDVNGKRLGKCHGVTLFERMIATPQGTVSLIGARAGVDSAGNQAVTKRATLTRTVAGGLVGAVVGGAVVGGAGFVYEVETGSLR